LKQARAVLLVGFGLVVGIFVGRLLDTPVQDDLYPTGTKDSLFHFPWNDRTSDDPEAREAAQQLLTWLDAGDRDSTERVEALQHSHTLFSALDTHDAIGSEYPTMAWITEWLGASESRRQELSQTPDQKRMLAFLNPGEFQALHRYLKQKYRFVRMGERERANFVSFDEVVRFNSPGRSDWERSDDLASIVDLKPGDQIADLGSGPGFFSFRFAEQVGTTGTVYAVDTNEQHLAYIERIAQREDLSQLRTILSNGTEVGAEAGSLDRVFMCATYQAVYGFTKPPDRDALMSNIRNSLSADGKLIISDNSHAVSEGQPYNGILVASSAVITQVEAYGFRLVESHQLVPQRYTLVFELDTTQP